MAIENVLRKRRADLETWLRENAPNADVEQRHLDAHSSEQAYWNYGYLVALKDVLALLSKRQHADLSD